MPKISPEVLPKDPESFCEHPSDGSPRDEPEVFPDSDSEDEIDKEIQEAFALPEDDEESEDDIEAETEEESNDDVDEALEKTYGLPDDCGLSADRLEATSVGTSCDELGKELKMICGLPDESDMDHSDNDEVDWKKKKWTQGPYLDDFNAVRLKASRFFLGKTRPIGYFTRFFDDTLIQLIVTQTNKYAEQNKFRNWKPVTAAEMRELAFERQPDEAS